MSKIYVCSDLHLGHSNIIKYCNRPYDNIEEMDNILIDNWNSVVNEDDTVFFLGDFCLGNREKIISYGNRLKGNKILIMGNHDRSSKTVYKEAGFSQIYKEEVVMRFDEYDMTIHFSHHRKSNEDTHYFNLYGHQHDRPTDDDNHRCVCIELLNYKPYPLDKIIEDYKNKK